MGQSCCTTAGKGQPKKHKNKVRSNFEQDYEYETVTTETNTPRNTTINHGKDHEGHKERETRLDDYVQNKIDDGVPWTDKEFQPTRHSLYDSHIDKLTSS